MMTRETATELLAAELASNGATDIVSGLATTFRTGTERYSITFEVSFNVLIAKLYHDGGPLTVKGRALSNWRHVKGFDGQSSPSLPVWHGTPDVIAREAIEVAVSVERSWRGG